MPILPLRTAPVRERRKKSPPSGRSRPWIRIGAVVLFLALLGAAWQWTPLKELVDLQSLSAWIEPHRDAWYALPLVSIAFVVLGLVMFPVLVMILATGVAFGPWLGSLYAMAGCLASASVGFSIGRRAGMDRLERVAGPRVRKLSQKLGRNGTLAVFVMRKIPAPYMLANVIVGASPVRFRDFMLGTVLGMGPMIIALAGFGYQLTRVVKHPTPGGIAIAVAFLTIPISLALLINHLLKRRSTSE
jgi:phospholipase D1/2